MDTGVPRSVRCRSALALDHQADRGALPLSRKTDHSPPEDLYKELPRKGAVSGELPSGGKSYTNNRFSLERFDFPKETCHVPMTRANLRALTKD